ncbi:MAG: T9SS type A sorting domain-containing protein [Bacteroidales bacterium]|nr:T9SS type A sorting domain-containing protein [Bacteroidales bacterium]
MKKLSLLIFIFFTVNSGILFAQTEDWSWQWANSNITNHFRSHGIKTDFNNDSYSYYWYIDSIIIGDTAFRHYGNYPNQQHFDLAIAKFDQNGEFINAVDIFTLPNISIWMPHMEIGPDSSIIVCGTYRDTVFVNNKVITTKHKDSRNMFIIKLNSDFEYIWSKTISSSAQEFCGGLDISDDNFIYLSSSHAYYPDSVVRIVDYLGQDSAVIGNGLNSILKIDSDGNLLWRKEIRSFPNGSAESDATIVGENGYIYSIGNATTNFVINNDTIIHPDYPNWGVATFITKYDKEGNLHNTFFVDKEHFSIYPWGGFIVDENSNYYISGSIWESTIFGSDTIIIPNNKTGRIIAKMDTSFQPLWCKYIANHDNIDKWFMIELYNDSLAIAFTGSGNFTFAGVDFELWSFSEGILGLFSPSGEFVSYQITETTKNSGISKFKIDNCDNFIINGYYKGIGNYSNDTLPEVYDYEFYKAKNYRYQPLPIDMPFDTSGCEELTIFGPKGYLYYKWNDELINQNWFLVSSTGTINLKVANEDGCWSEGESNVTIFQEIQLSLVEDTIIYLSDTLKLSICNTYEFYLWSTGDTTSDLSIPANELQIGNNKIWIDVDNGPCFASDTINVFVIDDSYIEDLYKNTILIYPNPANNKLNIVNKSNAIIESICIYNIAGQKLAFPKLLNNSIDIQKFQSGLYFIELISNKWKIRRKLIIN